VNTPFISICIPAYKKASSLERLLESIAMQTYKNYEVIITDDSPDDSVKQVADNFGHLPLSCTKNEPAAGMPANWNEGLLRARGPWIKIMHDDDWFRTADALEQFAAAASAGKGDFIFSACNNIYSSGKEVNEYLEGWRKEMLEDNTLNLFFLNVIGHPSTVMHRKDDAILYDTQFKWVVDIDFYIRYLDKHPGFTYIPNMLVNIGTNDLQMSSSLYKNPAVEIPEYLSMLAKFPPDLHLKHEYVFHCVWNLVKRFRVKSIQAIRDHGYSGVLPDKIQEIIDFQKPIPRFVIKQTNWSKKLMLRCFRKLAKV